MYSVTVIVVFAFCLATSRALPPPRKCPLNDCPALNLDDPKCYADAEEHKACVRSALESAAICQCDESLVKTKFLSADTIGAGCQDSPCNIPEVDTCSKKIQKAIGRGQHANEAIECIQKEECKIARCFKVAFGTVLTDKEVSRYIEAQLASLKLLAAGCDTSTPSLKCARKSPFPRNLCSNIDAADTGPIECMKQEFNKQGDVCDGAGDLADVHWTWYKNTVLAGRCQKEATVERIMAGCSSPTRSVSDEFVGAHERIARGVWPFQFV